MHKNTSTPETVLVVKYGGNAMGPELRGDPILDDAAALIAEGHALVLVHGGGPAIDAALRERGIVEERIAGQRVTGPESLAVVEAVLCAAVNKALVRALIARGVRAVGISGEDGGLLVASPAAPIDGHPLGYVGAIDRVDPALIHTLLGGGFTPVVAPVAIAADGSTPYNVNADTSAGALAGALRALAFIAITDVPKIRRSVSDPGSAVDRLTRDEVARWRAEGLLAGGMVPKVDACLEALAGGARRAIVAGGGPHAIRRALAGEGTEIVA